MKKIIFLTIIILTLICSVLAQGELTSEINQLKSELENKTIPGALGKLVRNQKINIHIDSESEQLILGVITEDKIVKEISFTQIDEPTLNIYIDEQTIQEIQSAENPFQTILDALSEEKITYQAVGWLNKIKLSFLSTFTWLTNIFSDEEEINRLKNVINQPPQEEIVEEELEAEEEEEELAVEEETEENNQNIIELTTQGFSPDELTIKVGETIQWKNTRTGKLNQMMILGTQKCSKIKSQLLGPQKTFEWTFSEPMTCTIVDGVTTTQTMKLIIQ